jgi:hypothetical protein
VTYRALKGIEVAGTAYVTGDLIHDLPEDAAYWLLGRHAIEPAEDVTPAPKASKKKEA